MSAVGGSALKIIFGEKRIWKYWLDFGCPGSWPIIPGISVNFLPMSGAGTNLHTWLALGDSYTIGESVEPGDRYLFQAVKLLGHAGLYFCEPEIIAQTGWTTSDLLKAIKEKKTPFPA